MNHGQVCDFVDCVSCYLHGVGCAHDINHCFVGLDYVQAAIIKRNIVECCITVNTLTLSFTYRSRQAVKKVSLDRPLSTDEILGTVSPFMVGEIIPDEWRNMFLEFRFSEDALWHKPETVCLMLKVFRHCQRAGQG